MVSKTTGHHGDRWVLTCILTADGPPRNEEEGQESWRKYENTSLESKSDLGRVRTRRTFTPLMKLQREEPPTERGSISKLHLPQKQLLSSLGWRNAFCCGDVCAAGFASAGTDSIGNQKGKTRN